MMEDEKYMDPKKNPLIRVDGESETAAALRRREWEKDGERRAKETAEKEAALVNPEMNPMIPGSTVDSEPGRFSGEKLNAALNAKYPDGGEIEIAGLRLMRFAGQIWADEMGKTLDRLPFSIRKAIEAGINAAP